MNLQPSLGSSLNSHHTSCHLVFCSYCTCADVPQAASKKDALLAAELKAKEKVRAHIKFDELNKQIEERQNAQKRKSDGIEGKNEEGEAAEESSDSDSDSSAERANQAPVPRKSRSRKKRKVSKGQDSLTADDGSTSTGKPKKKDTKKERKKSKENRTKRDKGE